MTEREREKERNERNEINEQHGGGGRKEMLTVCAIVTTSIMNSKAISISRMRIVYYM